MNISPYTPPGVVVTEGLGYTPTTTTPNDVVIAIVGDARGTLSGHRTMTLADTPVAISATGVVADSVAVMSRRDGALFVRDEDYAVADGESVTIARILTPMTHDLTEVTETVSLTAGVATQLSQQNIVGEVVVTGGGDPVTDISVDRIEGTVTLTSGDAITGAVVTYSFCDATAVEMSASPVAIALNTNIEAGSVVVSDLSQYDPATVFTEGDDYIVDYRRGTITLVQGGALSAGDLVYVAYDKCAIADGEDVRASFSFTPADYFSPTVLFDYASVVERYGQPFAPDGSIESELTLAAYHAFGNGAGVVVCVATQSGSNTDIIAGIDRIASTEGIDIVLPLSGQPVIHDYTQSSVRSSSFAGLERVAFLGFDGVDSPVPASEMISVAESVDSERIVLVAPSSAGMRNFVTGTDVIIEGYFLAAAVAGAVARNGRFTPVTMKSVSGFSSLATDFDRQTIGDMMKRGLCLVAPKSGALRVLHGRTTTNESVEKREISVVLNHDFIVRSVRTALSSGFIGSAIRPTTTAAISTATASVLGSLTSTGYLFSFSGVTALRPEGEPTTVEVRFSYKPSYALNYINVVISVDTTTA